MRIEHHELTHLVTQHYYVGCCEKMDDLNKREQQQIAIALLKDHSHFDACEILLYDDDPAKNMIAILEAHWHNKINAEEVVAQIYDIILKAGKEEIDKIFEEFANHHYWEILTTAKQEHEAFIQQLANENRN